MVTIEVIFGTIVGYITSMPLVVELIKRSWNEFVNNNLHIPKWQFTGWSARLMSWVVCILFALIGMWFNIGAFTTLNYFYVVLVGVIAGLAANGIFGIGVITWIANKLEKLINKKKEQ